MLLEHRPSWSVTPISNLLKNIQSSRLDFPDKHWRRETYGIPLLFYCWMVLFTNISYVTPLHSSGKMWICRLGFIWDWCSIILSSCSSGILDQRVSETMDRKSWTSSMACSFPWNNSFTFSYTKTPKICCLCYRSQWLPGTCNNK